jgi:hypothetical protein
MARLLFFGLMLLIFACSPQEEKQKNYQPAENALFKKLGPEQTGISFTNALTLREDFDVFRYRNYYNGGGIAIGDINNDGLSDVFMTSNMGDNKLFLNKGNWKFEDITEKAGVKGTKVWSTGVSMADVNDDGWLDIYVCNSGDINGENRENELFINNHDLTFTDQAPFYGLADLGFSTHAVFFDYDKDNDLDCYVLNNSFRPISTLGYRNLRNQRDEFGGDKLYKNENGRFKDVSEEAGIYGSVIGFGLGVTVGDVNEDNWPDLYISNDFYERDYLYINNHDGTFSEKLEEYMGHISMFSMGADLADLNNDGAPEIFSTDMMPEDNYRLKTLAAFETYDVYQLRLRNGYYHQFMRNMLHLNNKDGSFSEIGELAGVSSTDWSWGALMADFDNDSYKEIFVSNGIYKDVTNQDFVEFLGSSEQIHAAIDGKKINFQEFVDKMPSEKLSNYLFKRTGPLTYENLSHEWGLDEPSFSNGAAYGDLDNDGDLDLIVNNVNQEVFVYQNQLREKNNGNHFLTITFKGKSGNRLGLGTKVSAFCRGEQITLDQMPIRGFQSSMDYKMIIGLGAHASVDSLVVQWPDDKIEIARNVAANTNFAANYSNAKAMSFHQKQKHRLLQPIDNKEIAHVENDFNDFDRDRLLYNMLSTQGPAFAKADLNHDGYDDVFIGGSQDHPGALYMQRPGNKFEKAPIANFAWETGADDTDALFFDFDGDKDLDLYIVTGGSENLLQSSNNLDRLYENKGLKNGIPLFEKAQHKLPALYQSGSCVRPSDVDHDGDLDLFVGTRVIPSYYGVPADQFILLNDGKGNFSDATQTLSPELSHLGMVTDAAWFDYDQNGFEDLLIVGEWMPVTLFLNDGKQLKKTSLAELNKTEGFWNTIHPADLDGDGDIDFVLGNLGLNSKFKPSLEKPLSVYVNDFDQNGSIEPVYAFLKDGKEYPLALRQDIVKQMSSLKKKFVYYKDYADKSIADIFDKNLLERATKLNAYEGRTCLLINNNGHLQLEPLPIEAQASPVFAVEVLDVNGDHHPDILMGGNLFAVKPEIGRYDAMHGLVLLGNGKGKFTATSSLESGLKIEGEVRHIAALESKNTTFIAFIRNNNTVQFYTIRK